MTHDMINDIVNIYAKWGMQKYDELLSQIDHAVQCAALAQQSGASDDLIVASLLHDIGHLLELESKSGNVNIDIDDKHESTGTRYLAKSFGSGVTAPIALHVDAKRYLCAVEPAYFDTLSEGSVRSLELQGGPMNNDEARRFEGLAGFKDAVSLRRWDEQGKILDLEVAPFSTYVPMMQSLLQQQKSTD
jgi:phosphonate degradation associated HDIG domain protein